jgi:hypothetical protein
MRLSAEMVRRGIEDVLVEACIIILVQNSCVHCPARDPRMRACVRACIGGRKEM